jgi:hypothetical protein
MEDGDEADLRAEMTWVRGNLDKGVGRRPEEEGVEGALVPHDERIELVGEGEDDMEVWDG